MHYQRWRRNGDPEMLRPARPVPSFAGLSETVLAYMAGMIDADGSIYLRMRNGAGTLHIRLQVANTDETIMDWLKLHFAGRRYAPRRKQAEHHKPLHLWHLNGAGAYQALKLIAPYMVIKRPRAELAIEAWEQRTPIPREEGRRVKGTPDNIIEMRRGYVDRMRTLNKKGVA